MLIKSLSLLAAVMLGHNGAPTAADDTLTLNGVTISARVASASKSSLRLTDISREMILQRATGNTFPELMRNVPGIYSTAETGSYGDAKINIRGFKQENIAILLNGIPISGLTSGSMYWNNWMGLADATASIQVQKGIGNSMLADNSVGGTINIITTQPSEKASSEVGYSLTGYGTNSAFFNVNSGSLGKGWSFNLMGSHNWGSSYVEKTGLSTWSYLATIVKKFGSRNSLNFTALGSPERHEQRSSRLTYSEVEKYGFAYSKNWGYYTDDKGEKKERTLSQNTYFKPYFTLTHTYDSRDGSRGVLVVNSIYTAIANGGGFYTESTGRRIAAFLDQDGHIDWDAAKAFNQTVVDQNGKRAQNIMSDYLAGHVQAGLKSSVIFNLGESINIDAGLHYQIFKTWEKERITDLLGADYWYEDYANKSIGGLMGRNPIKKVGDYVRTQNGRDQNYGTIYAIGTFNPGGKDNTIVTLGVSAGGTVLRRWDLYNYSEADKFSKWASKATGSIKGGILQKVSRSSSIYANAAAVSRAPYANVFFSNGNNSISKDITNEKNYMGELGYRFVGSKFSAEATAYGAYWKDKSLLSNAYKSLDEDPYKFMIKGLDAIHYGVEVNATYKIVKGTSLSAYASYGQWKWKNDVNATIYDPYTMQPASTIKVFSDGLHVGDAPQTQIGAFIESDLSPLVKGLALNLDWNFNDRLWADFDPITRTNENDRSDSYRIPSYHLVNMGLSYSNKIGVCGFTVFANVRNITNALYIERSKDGTNHDKDTFQGYWGNRRNFNFGIRLKF
ncbi:MAG: TonB-dependent receptor plug domain-containing protein [Bacteroidales bacterium]|nr:TonB-dependent receptor plug domain-containing protein [Bacteroidales bacterium]